MVSLALDRSGSMKGAPVSAAVEAALQFVDVARPDDSPGLVLFDGVAEQRTRYAPNARGTLHRLSPEAPDSPRGLGSPPLDSARSHAPHR